MGADWPWGGRVAQTYGHGRCELWLQIGLSVFGAIKFNLENSRPEPFSVLPAEPNAISTDPLSLLVSVWCLLRADW